MKTLSPMKRKFVEACVKRGYAPIITRQQVIEVYDAEGMSHPQWLLNNAEYRVQRGVYQLPVEGLGDDVVQPPAQLDAPISAVQATAEVIPLPVTPAVADRLVPAVDKLFVPFGFFPDLVKILESKLFYPAFITGLSGNGKTYMVLQAAAKAKREVIRVNLTTETDEDDLIGGLRLVNGNTDFEYGPVIKAMKRGAVLLLDEIDLAHPAKILCLQSILEGVGYFIKKTGEMIVPADGFTVVATANTKGKGSDDGQFIGTNVMNEAFLERFPITIDQEYPSKKIEIKIMKMVFASLGLDKNDTFITRLVEWATIVRKTYAEDAVDEIIATRRLVHIAKAFAIFRNRLRAVELCVARFDDETRGAFIDLYTKVDADATKEEDRANRPDPGSSLRATIADREKTQPDPDPNDDLVPF